MRQHSIHHVFAAVAHDKSAACRMAWIGNSEKHAVIARSIARMSFRIHDVPEFHFYSIADGTSDILKCRGGRWRGFDPSEAEKDSEASLFAFFGLNTG